MIAIGTWVINTIVYSLNTDILALKLESRQEKIKASYRLLEESGVSGIAQYVTETQDKPAGSIAQPSQCVGGTFLYRGGEPNIASAS